MRRAISKLKKKSGSVINYNVYGKVNVLFGIDSTRGF